jgi:Tol biopolymer transport system component
MPPHGPSRDAVLQQLEKILSSGTFATADRSRALLKFLIERTLDDHSGHLKEYTLGSEVLGRGESFDPRTDPIVRAEASRLRGRLERYYASDGATDAVRIVVPKGSYVPRFQLREETAMDSRAEPQGVTPAFRTLQKLPWFGLGSVTVAVAAAFLIRSFGRVSPPERVVALTALPGLVWWPTFSPDGRQVAFVWTGDKAGNYGIYVKMVGSSELRRVIDAHAGLTGIVTAGSPPADPLSDFGPQWSPDGLQIAFVRSTGPAATRGTIHLVSALGGPGRKLSDWPAVWGPLGALSWSRDARFLAAGRGGFPDETAPEAWGIYLVPLDGGEPRLLVPAQRAGRNLTPAFSPDGRHLAYAACGTREATPCDVHVVDLTDDVSAIGSPHRVTRQGLYSINRIAWTQDGRWLLYDTEVGPQTFYLWRVAADGSTPPERIEIAGVGAWLPAAADGRLAFARWRTDADIVRFAPDRSREAFPASSSYWDGSAHFSPDGQRVALESMRSGERQEIWVANADGSDSTQLTHGPGRLQGSPAWSPDGRRIVFDSQGADGHWDIYVLEVTRGVPRRLTMNPGDENVPQWSRDGRWIYFSGRRDGQGAIWRIPSEGGIEERVVDKNGAVTVGTIEESADGEELYFTTAPGSPLFAHPLKGGPDRKLVDCVSGLKAFAVAGGAIYYADCDNTPTKFPPSVRLHRLDVQSGDDRVLGSLESYRGSLMVSPDERTILYTSVMRTGSDLMLIENFGERPASR